MGNVMTIETQRHRTGLGRGLAALIPPSTDGHQPLEIPLDRIRHNPYQPRTTLEPGQLDDLARSVAEHGVLQPILVTRTDDGYQLIAGERRVRAAQLAGLSSIPAIVRSADEQAQLALALVENIQRADLNAMDEAVAFRQLIDEFGLTQEQVAQRVGRSRPAIANTLRLLGVAPAIQQAVREGRVTEGHARALAGIEDQAEQVRLLEVIERRSMSVRQTEDLVRNALSAATDQAPARATEDPDLERLESGLRDALGTRVTVTPGRSGGRITITWFSEEDLTRLYDQITGGSR
jgi:ParB family chromosome partitioning protein